MNYNTIALRNILDNDSNSRHDQIWPDVWFRSNITKITHKCDTFDSVCEAHHNVLSVPLLKRTPQLAIDQLLYSQRLLVIPYEELKKDPIAQVRRALAFLGVPADEGRLECLRRYPDGPVLGLQRQASFYENGLVNIYIFFLFLSFLSERDKKERGYYSKWSAVSTVKLIWIKTANSFNPWRMNR